MFLHQPPQPGDLGDPRWHYGTGTIALTGTCRNQGTWAILVGTVIVPSGCIVIERRNQGTWAILVGTVDKAMQATQITGRNQGTWAILVGTTEATEPSPAPAATRPQPGDLGDPRWHRVVLPLAVVAPKPQPGDLGDPRWHRIICLVLLLAGCRNQGTWAILVGTAPPIGGTEREPGRNQGTWAILVGTPHG